MRLAVVFQSAARVSPSTERKKEACGGAADLCHAAGNIKKSYIKILDILQKETIKIPHSSTDALQIAGWSSQVARQAHNLKVAGSNPAPVTNFKNPASQNLAGFYLDQNLGFLPSNIFKGNKNCRCCVKENPGIIRYI